MLAIDFGLFIDTDNRVTVSDISVIRAGRQAINADVHRTACTYLHTCTGDYYLIISH
jgi:hypothetical protein